jgi:2-C-methyl-D-erythritol 2,4-cyclodiphosphate synthase
MRQNLADTLKIPLDRISVKATTEEKLGFTGEKLGISTHAVCTMVRKA